MKTASFKMPDGTIETMPVPDNTTPEQAQALFNKSKLKPVEPEAIAPTEPDSIAKDAFDVIGEIAAANNRSVTEFIDFIGPDTVNAILNLSGSDVRMPTLTDSLEPTGIRGGFMEPGIGRDVARGVGGIMPAAAGLKTVTGRDLTKAGGAAAEFLGVGSAKAIQPIKAAIPATVDAIQQAIPSKARNAARLPLLRESGDTAAAGFKLDDAGKVIKDRVQRAAIDAGVDQGAVAMLSAANKATKSRIRQMVDVIGDGIKNLEFRSVNPPSKIVGDVIHERLGIIQTANKTAAGRLDDVANGLKGRSIDVRPAIKQYLKRLSDDGIIFDEETGLLDFSDSIIEGDNLKKAQGIIKAVTHRLFKTKDPTHDAFRVHKAKRFIDEQVTYGKSPEGLSGRMEGIIKELRHDLDGALDVKFKDYDEVNTIYKETRDMIDDLQGLAGQKVNLHGANVNKALGVMSRKVLSNYNTGTAMEDMFLQLDELARKYSTPLDAMIDDELGKIIPMEAELRRLFPTAIKQNTFQGLIGTEVSRPGRAKRAIKAVGGFVSDIDFNGLPADDEQNTLKALKDLLDQ